MKEEGVGVSRFGFRELGLGGLYGAGAAAWLRVARGITTAAEVAACYDQEDTEKPTTDVTLELGEKDEILGFRFNELRDAATG